MEESLSMDQAFIKKLTDIVLANLANENFGAEELAKEAVMSHSTLNRKLRSIKNQDASQFIREVRLQKAMEMLENNEGTAAEIAFRVGFGSPAYFTKCFHKYYGYTPGDIRKGISETSEVSKKVVEPLSTRKKSNIATIIAGSVILLVLVTLGLFFIPKLFKAPEQLEKSIAVLPFVDMSLEKDQAPFCEGIAEEIINTLGQVEDFKVIARISAFAFRDKQVDIREIGRILDVETLLEGSIRKDGNRLRITVQLVKVSGGSLIWSKIYDRDISDIFEIQSEVAQNVARSLKATLNVEEKEKINKYQTQNPEAYNLYLQGRFFVQKRTIEGIRKSIEYYEK